MKSKSFLTLLTAVFISCQFKTENRPGETKNPYDIDDKIRAIPTGKMELITYDGCE